MPENRLTTATRTAAVDAALASIPRISPEQLARVRSALLPVVAESDANKQAAS